MLTRWKILACSLTVGVGGLAVFATPPADTKKEPQLPEPPALPKLTVKPDSPPNGTDTPAPPAGTRPGPGLEFDLDLPTPPPVKAPEKPKPAPVEIEIPTPPVILPVKGEGDDKKPAGKKEEPAPKADSFVAPPLPELKADPPPLIPVTKPPVVPPLPPSPEIAPPVAPIPPTIKPEESKPIPPMDLSKLPTITPEPA